MTGLYGMGALSYGRAKRRDLEGEERRQAEEQGYGARSYQMVRWFTVLLLPVVPLGTYRVVHLNRSFWTPDPWAYYMAKRVPWDWVQVCRHFLIGASIVLGVIYFLERAH